MQSYCPYCSSDTAKINHQGICPKVKSFEYYPTGELKRVEFHAPPSPLPTVFGSPTSIDPQGIVISGISNIIPSSPTFAPYQVKHMVDRFLGWRLPDDLSPDCGISFKRTFNDHLPMPSKHEPTGTNLLTATQADAMVRYMLQGMP